MVNKQDYLETISHTIGNENIELIYKIIVEKEITKKELRDAVIVKKYDEYRAMFQNETIRDIYYRITEDFDCNYRMVERAVIGRRNNKTGI